MIKANELRIGNWVSFKGLWNGEVASIGKGACIEIKDNKGLFVDECFQGIELSDEILIKAGFTKSLHGCANGHAKFYIDNFWMMRRGDEYHYVPTGVYVFPVSSLHQLQNLYFALTGTELEVKL